MPTRKRICGTEGCHKQGKYLGRVWVDGTERYLGYYCCKRERTAAQEAYRVGLRNVQPSDRTCDDVADEFLAEYEERHKASSLTTARQSLKPFRDKFGDRPIGSITRDEAKRWAKTQPGASLPVVVTLMNWAVDEELIPLNRFNRLTRRSRGRADKAPPTVREFKALLDACDALGDYAPRMRDFLEFASYTLMRPGELFELRWTDIDFASNQIHKDRRLYRGIVDVPKTGRKTLPLPPPARDILLRQPTRAGELVFLSKQGKRLTAPTFSQYWAIVRARAGLDFVPYEATKHYGVHALYVAGVSSRTIGKLAGWSEDDVEAMLKVYGHADVAAQAEIDALYARPTDAEVAEFNAALREDARREVEAGSTCPVQGAEATGDLDAEFYDRFVHANLESWREAGMSEDDIERRFAGFTPPIREAYYRITDARTDARNR